MKAIHTREKEELLVRTRGSLKFRYELISIYIFQVGGAGNKWHLLQAYYYIYYENESYT